LIRYSLIALPVLHGEFGSEIVFVLKTQTAQRPRPRLPPAQRTPAYRLGKGTQGSPKAPRGGALGSGFVDQSPTHTRCPQPNPEKTGKKKNRGGNKKKPQPPTKGHAGGGFGLVEKAGSFFLGHWGVGYPGGGACPTLCFLAHQTSGRNCDFRGKGGVFVVVRGVGGGGFGLVLVGGRDPLPSGRGEGRGGGSGGVTDDGSNVRGCVQTLAVFCCN